MANEHDVDEATKLFKLLEKLSQESGRKVERSNESQFHQYAPLVPVVITVIGFIFYTGMQAKEWDQSKDQTKLELRAEFIEKMSDQQGKNNDLYRDLSEQIKTAINENRNLKLEVDTLKQELGKNTSKDEAVERTVDGLYRNQQYLKSLHNINTPPNM